MNRRWLLVVLLGHLASPIGAVAQKGEQDTVAAAVRLRDAGDFAGAIALLRARVASKPDDGTALRLLAQTWYWARQPDSARSTYEQALRRHPQDLQARLDYGRMLVETRDAARAREILRPLVTSTAMRSAAETLLGTLDYWSGDLSGAVHHFKAALRADPGATEARRQWREIAVTTSPWLRTTAEGGHDDQPLDRIAGTIEAGGFVTPLWSLGVRGRWPGFAADPSTRVAVPEAEAIASGYIPHLRLETDLAGGFVWHSYGQKPFAGIGRVAPRFRLGKVATLGGRAEWKPYLYTVASLETPVMIRELAATFTLSAPGGWLGETSYGQQRYPDANTVSSGYAWLLVPLVSHQPAVFQVGYAFSAQNSTQSRFVLADTAQAFPPADPRFSLAGQYVPYYTPMRLVSHAAIASLVLRSRTGTTFTAGGSYSFFARDDAPVFMRAGAPPTVVRASYRRSSEPWNAHVRLQGLVNRDLALGLTAEYNRTAFYRAGSVRVELVYRFGNAAVRRVDRF